MIRRVFPLIFLFAAPFCEAQKPYFPPKGDAWERRTPAQVGMDAALLEKAMQFARENETTFPRDYSTQVQIFGKMLGPLPKEHAATNAIVIRHGYIVAEFGATTQPDPTYSAAKSYLSTLLGVALDQKRIKSITDPVAMYVKDGGYDEAHNAKVTWLHHAQQTSEWQGALFGKDHRFLSEEEHGNSKRQPRDIREPGSFYEYNDVRVNRFSLSLLRVFKRPLPEVLKTEILDPIGASDTWKWVPYSNSEVELDGKKVFSVSGGSRWGGGLWISARDHARFGLLYLRNGKWGDRQVLSPEWIKTATTAGAQNAQYGCLWWLNTNGKQWKGVSEKSYAAVGHGSNTVWIDPEHDLVVVWRWHKGNGAEFFRRVVESLKGGE